MKLQSEFQLYMFLRKYCDLFLKDNIKISKCLVDFKNRPLKTTAMELGSQRLYMSR